MVSFISCTNYQVIDPATLVHEKIFEFPGRTKGQLYEKSKQWFVYNFKSAKSVIEYDSLKEGKIIGKALLGAGHIAGNIWTAITIDVKDNKTRLNCSPISISYRGADFPFMSRGFFIHSRYFPG
jgi:hypothetical protein